jgi:hypothetical protein
MLPLIVRRIAKMTQRLVWSEEPQNERTIHQLARRAVHQNEMIQRWFGSSAMLQNNGAALVQPSLPSRRTTNDPHDAP